MSSQPVGDVVVDRAGVGHFLADAEFGERLQNEVRLDLQFPRKHIYSDLAHIENRHFDAGLAVTTLHAVYGFFS